MKKIKRSAFDQQLGDINRFEAMLAQEDTLILKFWFHLSQQQQAQQLKALSKDSETRWRVTDTDWHYLKYYEKYRAVSEHALRLTNTGYAPWIVVAGANTRYALSLLGAPCWIRCASVWSSEAKGWRPRLTAAPWAPTTDTIDLLNGTFQLDQPLANKAYDRQLETLQGRLAQCTRQSALGKRSLILVFEGQDAAGKGGTIRRITGALDARQYRVVPISAPTEEEQAQPYLWRFWRHVPT